MARNRTPVAKAEVSGSASRHPARFKDRQGPKRTKPIGEPYVAMTDAQKAMWRELSGEMPWLHSAHRMLLRLACVLAARLDTSQEFGVQATQALSSLLSKLGATPVDETKVKHGDAGDEEDPAEAFFGRPN